MGAVIFIGESNRGLKCPPRWPFHALVFGVLNLFLGFGLAFFGSLELPPKIKGFGDPAEAATGSAPPLCEGKDALKDLLPDKNVPYVFAEAEEALADPNGRVDPQFRVPEELRERVQFWFNVYTRYSKFEHVFHHALYPWIVYKVVDTSSIFLNPSGQVGYYTRNYRAQELLKKERLRLRLALRSLSRRKSFARLSGLELEIFNSLQAVPGPRRKVIREASVHLRSQLGQKDFFISGIYSSTKYLAHLEDEFRKMGLPTDLTRIPFVESSFNVKAESRVGASGVWQIMPVVGASQLLINQYIDERNSPVKGARVAGRILQVNRKILGNWPLAVTAYNHGVGSIMKVTRRVRSKNLPTIIKKYHQGSFRFASANFYTSFLAALHAEKYHEEVFGIHSDSRHAPDPIESVRLRKRMTPQMISSLVGLSTEELVRYNLDIRKAAAHRKPLPMGFKLFLPVGRRNFLENKRLASRDETQAKKL